MKNSRIFVSAISIAVAFFVGRMSVGWMDGHTTSPRRTLVDDTSIPERDESGKPAENDGRAGISAREKSNAESHSNANLPGADGFHVKSDSTSSVPIAPKTKLSSAAAQQCLAQVTRHDLVDWTSALEMKLGSFLETDSRFASRVKLSAGDWNRIANVGDISGTVQFKFETAQSSKLRIAFKDQQISLEVHYRPSDVKNRGDTAVNSGSWTLRNGSGLGIAHDGGGYHAVMENPVQEPDWSAYSHFAVSIPFDWDRKSEVTSEVFGLTEEMKWEGVGMAKLQHAKSAEKN